MHKILIGLTLPVLLLVSPCAQAESWNAPLDYFRHAHGPAAGPTQILDWVFTGIVCAVCIVIACLLLVAIFLKRQPREAREITEGGRGPSWIAIGTALSTILLFAMAIYALQVLNVSAMPSDKPGLTITVTAYDWWWRAKYESANVRDRFVTANEIHIPVGMPVLVKLNSADVIHAFWVPQLAGKTQAIPGLTTQQWLQADEPGVYRGQCTQFCGLQHAHMAFEVIAESPAAFEQWEQDQRKTAASTALNTSAGQKIFMDQCGACHTVRGTAAAGDHAPDLTHLGSRSMIGAGLMTNTPEHLSDWIAHAQELKPGSRMPDIALPADQAAALSTYLATLK